VGEGVADSLCSRTVRFAGDGNGVRNDEEVPERMRDLGKSSELNSLFTRVYVTNSQYLRSYRSMLTLISIPLRRPTPETFTAARCPSCSCSLLFLASSCSPSFRIA
jgi:hypothetical protein